MNEEDYFKYYIQGSDHYLIPKYVFEELFDEMSNWRDESKQLKEVIEEVREYVEKTPISSILEVHCGYEEEYTKPLLQILDKAKWGMNNEWIWN